MIAAKVTPNEVSASTLASHLDNVTDAAELTALLAPLRVTGPGYLGAVVRQLAISLEADSVLGWVYETGQVLGFVPRPAVFEPALTLYRRQHRLDQALRIVMPFPHLPASQKLLREFGHLAKVADYFELQFKAGPEPHNAAKALAHLYDAQGKSDLRRHWAEIALGFPDQHEKRVAALRQLRDKK